MNKRQFIKAGIGIMAVAAIHPLRLLGNYSAKDVTLAEHRLWDELSAEELIQCEDCKLSKVDEEAKVKQGYKCGQILLERYLEIHKLDQSVFDAGIGIGDGFGKKDRCCLLIAPILIFGLHASGKSEDLRAKISLSGKMNQEFWDWWLSVAPLNCCDIQPNCYQGYPNMYKRTALKVQEITTKYE